MELTGITLVLAGVAIAILAPVLYRLISYGHQLLESKLAELAHSQNLFNYRSFSIVFDLFKSELREVTQDAVDALDQIYVKGWKEKSEDGKLTADEINELNKMLVDTVLGTLSKHAREFLEAAVPNLSDLILEIGEAYIGQKRAKAAEDTAGN